MIVQHFVPYLKSGIPYHWKIPFGKPIELYRCRSDGTLLTNKTLKIGTCAGHQISQPAMPDFLELIFLFLRIIR